jgi:glycosyltransferase involved in cell wall biosynthesis
VRAVPEARVVILGEGDLRDELSRLIHELGLERHVLLPGFRPDVLSLLKAFDVFVMPSITEGLGTSILDAMACTKAVVASDVGGIPEVVERDVTGLLVPARDASALSAAVIRLLRDQALTSRLAAAGRARVEKRFTADRMVQETLDVYHRLRA